VAWNWPEYRRSPRRAASRVFAALVVMGTEPLELDEPSLIAATVVLVLTLLGVAFAKGRVLRGVVGLFVPLVAAVRLARP
jgi:hypothetical protein